MFCCFLFSRRLLLLSPGVGAWRPLVVGGTTLLGISLGRDVVGSAAAPFSSLVIIK